MTGPLLRLATALALVLSASTAIAQSNSGPTPLLNVGTSEHAISRKLDLSIGRSLIVELPRDAKEVFVANPKVANAVVRTARKLFVIGIALVTARVAFGCGGRFSGGGAGIDGWFRRCGSRFRQVERAALSASRQQQERGGHEADDSWLENHGIGEQQSVMFRIGRASPGCYTIRHGRLARTGTRR